MPRLSLSVLGPFTAYLDERPLTQFRTKSVQALLVYLACQPEAHSREQLMTLLWPGLPQKSAQGSLRQTLYLLRKAIPELPSQNGDGTVPLLLTDRQAVQMNPNGCFDLDLHTFTDKLKGDESGWAEAVALYRGDFLADFYLADSVQFEEWTLARRADLRRQVLEALETLTDYTAQIGDLDAAEAHARRQLEIDNLRESAHRQLMEILARNGRRAAALAQYEACVVVLHNELAVTPSTPTESLYAAIRDEMLPTAPPPTDSGPTWLAAAARDLEQKQDLIEKVLPTLPAVLPIPETPLIGRQAEMAELNALLAEPAPRLITILGPGGIGKTRLALAAGHAAVEETRFTNGVFFLDLTPINDPAHILPALADLLNLSLKSESSRTPQKQLLDYLRQKKALLILDNFEHLLAGGDLLTDILRAAPDVRLLTTSRERLNRPGEQVFPLRGFSTADGDGDETAVQLFCQSARRSRPNFNPDEGETAVICRICQLVDGMPLAIELAAAWVDMLPLTNIAAEIKQSLDILAVDGGLPQRHRSMYAVFDSTWRGLDQSEQEIFAGLSVFRGGFTRQAAETVTGASLRQLARLQSKSLLQYRRSHDRYQIHELLRQFAAEKLTNGDDPERHARVLDRHTAFYCDFLAEQGKKLRGAEQKTAVAEISTEIENGRAAWGWAAKQRDLLSLERGLNGLLSFHDWQAYSQEGIVLSEQALKALDGLDAAPALRLKIRLLVWQAIFVDRVNRQDDGIEIIQQGLEILETLEETETDVRLEQALLWGELGTYEQAGTVDTRQDYLKRSLVLFEELDEPWLAARARWFLGEALWRSGVYQEAEALCRQSLAEFEAMGDRLNTGFVQASLALLTKHLGRLDEAEQLQLASLETIRALGSRYMEAGDLFSLSVTRHEQGRLAEGLQLAEDADCLYQELGDVKMQGAAKTSKAQILTFLGRYREAHQEMAEAVSLVPHDKTGYIPMSAGLLALAEGNFAAAQENLALAVACYRERNLSRSIGITLVYLAMASIKIGDLSEARTQLKEALQLGVETRAAAPIWEGLAAAALLAAVEGRSEQAVALFARAAQEPIVGRSHYFAKVVGEQIAAACEASLPPDEVERLKGQGRAMDMWETAASLLTELSERD